MKKPTRRRRTPLFEVRHSPIHGYGVFAARRIRKGTTVVEYLGDRVSHAQADARYEDKDPNDNHTFLFTVDAKTVIDGGVNGNEARFINHGCDPNCESSTRNKRIFIDAIRTIQPGEELAYDYQIQRDSDDAPNVDEIFACRCGAKNCRGSMLEAPKKPRKAARRPPARAPARAAARAPARAPARAAARGLSKKGGARKRAARRGGPAKGSQRRSR
jgi:SET domain-containing protein